MGRWRVLCVALLIAATAPEPPIRVSTRVHVASEPASIPVIVRVEPHPDNRLVCLSYESEAQSSRSCWQIEPDAAPSTFRWLTGLPAGEYVISAELYRQGAKPIRSASVPVIVTSSR